MANEFVARKGLIIKSVPTGTTENKILVIDDNGLAKLRTSISLGGTSGTSGSSGVGSSGTSGSSGVGSSGTSGTSGGTGSSGTSGTGSSGTSGTSGAGTSGSSGTSGVATINNNTNDYVLTATGTAGTINGETNLRFDGTNLSVLGGVMPRTTTTYDLGSASLRWNVIYTADMSLKNEYGDYTIVEGEEDLFLYNNKSGRVFKFALIEVDKSIVPPKKDV